MWCGDDVVWCRGINWSILLSWGYGCAEVVFVGVVRCSVSDDVVSCLGFSVVSFMVVQCGGGVVWSGYGVGLG